jgi:phospholipid/cholesterol/gamma-HCH transport system permease protein
MTRAERGGLGQLAGILTLTIATAGALVARPIVWPRDFVDECWRNVKRCAFPVWISIFFFHFGAVGIVGGELFKVLGTDERVAYFPPVGTMRETGPFIAAIVVAGVAGTAMAADLGARKVREELDAMSVLGIDPIRKLVAPRVLAAMVATPLVAIPAWEVNTFATYLTATIRFGVEPSTFFHAFAGSLNSIEMYASVIKTTLFGLIIGLVFCYAGLHAKGGSEGVGRAVNQSVVTAVVVIFLVNFAFNASLLGAFPELQGLR